LRVPPRHLRVPITATIVITLSIVPTEPVRAPRLGIARLRILG